MKALLNWIDDRTGVSLAVRRCLDRPVPGGVGWCKVWPSTVAFCFCVQVITGFFLWMYYSPSAQTAWESVYFLQHEVTGGWLLRAVHHWSAQVLLVLIGVYLLKIILLRTYQAPREFVFWTVVLMGLVTLGLLLTGDLLAWDQNSFASTKVRVSFLTLLPLIGSDLFKLVAGGPAFGHHTLTRFVALHVGLFSVALLVLLWLHYWLARRVDAAEAEKSRVQSPESRAGGFRSPPPSTLDSRLLTLRYWPYQALRNIVACLVVLVVVFALASQHGLSGDHAGIELGSPADPASTYAAARPEWAFLGLYQFSKLGIFPGEWKILPIFVIPGLLVVVVLAMPWIARFKAGHWFNVGLIGVLLIGVVVLSCVAVSHDRHDQDHQAALAAESRLADRVRQLARAEGIPASGALTLLRNDPKTQGPKLCQSVCASCHNYSAAGDSAAGDSAAGGEAVLAKNPSAPELYGFATRQWLAGFMDPEKIKGPEYFGNTRFARGVMVRYVEGRFAKLKDQPQRAIIAALAAEAQLGSPHRADQKQRDLIEQGRQLIAGEEGKCTRCHVYRGHGPQGSVSPGVSPGSIAPDLTGYGSRQWIVGIVANPTHARFYGLRNDRMLAYLEFPDKPADNLLAAREVGILADWLRGEWYEPEGGGIRDEGLGISNSSTIPNPQSPIPVFPNRPPIAVLLDRWQPRQPEQLAAAATGPHAEARRLFQREHCSICHDYTGAQGDDVVAATPSAPDLGGYASREWIRGLLDPQQIRTRKYFGNSRFRTGAMANFVREMFSDMEDEDKEDLEKLVIALSAEAGLPSQRELDQRDAAVMQEGRDLLVDGFGCTDCHRFHGTGGTDAPDLTGYGSPDWLAALIADPAHKRLYGDRNDGMPSYLAFADQPARNLLTADQIAVLVDMIRGETDAK